MTVYVVYAIYEYKNGGKHVSKEDGYYLSFKEAKAKCDEPYILCFAESVKK